MISLLAFCYQMLDLKAGVQTKSNQARSISTETELGADVNAAVFLGPNKFYAVANENAANSMARVEMFRSQEEGSEGTWKVEFKPMAPEDGVTVNNLEDQSSPLNAQNLKLLTIGAYVDNYQCPVTGLISTSEDPEDPTKVLIFQVLDLSDGKYVLKTADATAPDETEYALKDTGTDNAQGLHAIAATKNFSSGHDGKNLIFALTSNNESLESSELTKIGVNPIAVNADFLNPLDAANFRNSGENNTSAKILDALKIVGEPVFFGPTSADMTWDDKLKTLYVAVSKLKTSKNENEGAVALLIGKISGNKLEISKITDIAPTPLTFTAGDKTQIIGYVNGDTEETQEQTISLYKVRVMHTSTGKDYVLVNGQVVQDSENDSTENVVFALPLASDGTLAELVTNADARALVGKDFHYLVHGDTDVAFLDAPIKDLQAFGDTAYVAVAGSRSATGQTGEAGIFASTAIFSQDATIRAWTPWQRVMGCTDQVFNIGFDKNSSNFWYIGPDQKTAKITLWSEGDTSESGLHEGEPLSKALQEYFFEDQLGVVGLFNFDDETLGFKSWNPNSAYPAFSMMIAAGFGKIALIQTGKREEDDVFAPTKQFLAKKVEEADETTNVFVFDNLVTQALGFVTCAEVSRIKRVTPIKPKGVTEPENCGWVFIGGQNGVAVLCQSDGSGWNTKTGLSELTSKAGSFPGTTYSFLKLNPPAEFNFTNIRKLVSDGKYLYILTRTDLYRLDMNAYDFRTNATIDASRIKHIAGVDSAFKDDRRSQVMNPIFDEFFDLLVVDNSANAKKLLIGTTQGAWLSGTIADEFNVEFLRWNRKIEEMGPALTFNFISAQRGGKFDTNNKANGNLYLTAIDSGFKHVNVYRFNVQDGEVKLFNEPYGDKYFYRLTDLNDLFLGMEYSGPLDHVANKYQVTESLPLTPDPDNFLPVTENGTTYYKAIDLGLDPQAALHLISVVQDTASGAPYIPGEFTVFVNE
jgi:hypothetical protein